MERLNLKKDSPTVFKKNNLDCVYSPSNKGVIGLTAIYEIPLHFAIMALYGKLCCVLILYKR